MALTMVIAVAAFVAMVAMLVFGYQRIENERSGRAESILADAPMAKRGHCMLCNAPLRQATTPDEVVVDIEHRIDSLIGIGGLALPLHRVEIVHIGLIGLFIVAEQTHRISRLEDSFV